MDSATKDLAADWRHRDSGVGRRRWRSHMERAIRVSTPSARLWRYFDAERLASLSGAVDQFFGICAGCGPWHPSLVDPVDTYCCNIGRDNTVGAALVHRV